MQDAQCVSAMRRRLRIPSTFTFSNSTRRLPASEAPSLGKGQTSPMTKATPACDETSTVNQTAPGDTLYGGVELYVN
tara:strand:- start:356 stop:586 length:231 start_codon:yes stop_codon:yes gene_type:complete